MKKAYRQILFLLIIVFVVSQTKPTSWWNPLNWEIFSKINIAGIPPLPAANVTANAFVPPKQTKTSGCAANQVLQDPACTPGEVLTADISVICKSGYTKTVRDVPLSEKEEVFAEYGIPYSLHGNYEVDHLISLELGGSNSISNLWPENSTIENGSLTKDKFENYLHGQVCSGKMAISEAQKEISTGWLEYYQAFPGN